MLKQFKAVLSSGYKTVKYAVKSDLTSSKMKRIMYQTKAKIYEHQFDRAVVKLNKELTK